MTRFFVTTVLLLFLVACHKKQPDVSATPSENIVSDTLSTTQAVPAGATPPRDPFSRPTSPPSVPQPVAVPADASAALGALTQAVRKYSAERQKVPQSLAEVANAGYLQNIPQPPPGKKFVLNPRRLEVTLE